MMLWHYFIFCITRCMYVYSSTRWMDDSCVCVYMCVCVSTTWSLHTNRPSSSTSCFSPFKMKQGAKRRKGMYYQQ